MHDKVIAYFELSEAFGMKWRQLESCLSAILDVFTFLRETGEVM